MDVIVLLRVVFLMAFLIPLLRCLYYHTVNCGSDIIESIIERIKKVLLGNNKTITGNKESGRDNRNMKSFK